jgi:hypothetical protein
VGPDVASCGDTLTPQWFCARTRPRNVAGTGDSTAPLFGDTDGETIDLGPCELDPHGNGQWQRAPRFSSRNEKYGSPRFLRGECEPAHDARPNPKSEIDGSAGNTCDVDDYDGERLGLDDANCRTGQPFERRANHDEPFELDTRRSNAWTVKCGQRIHECTKGHFTPPSDRFALSGLTRQKRHGRG